MIKIFDQNELVIVHHKRKDYIVNWKGTANQSSTRHLDVLLKYPSSLVYRIYILSVNTCSPSLA